MPYDNLLDIAQGTCIFIPIFIGVWLYWPLCTFQPTPLVYKPMDILVLHSVLPMFYPFSFGCPNKILQFIYMHIIGILFSLLYNGISYSIIAIIKLQNLPPTLHLLWCFLLILPLPPPQYMWNCPILLPLIFILKGDPGLLPLGIRNFHTQTWWGVQLPLLWILIYHIGWYFSIPPCMSMKIPNSQRQQTRISF